MIPRPRPGETPGNLASPIRLLVNATALRVGGGGTYIVEQIAALATQTDLEITVFTTPEIATRLSSRCGPAVRILARPARGLVRRLLYEQLVLPFVATDYHVVYQPGGFAMLASPRPQAVTNQNPHHFGPLGPAFARERYPPTLRAWMRLQRHYSHVSVRRADAFVTLSTAFQSSIEEDLGPQDNLHILPSAAPRLPDRSEAIQDPVVGNGPYALTVAHDYIHKDWDGLIHAFHANPDLPRLVIAGAWRNDERYLELKRLLESKPGPPRVTLLGSVGDRHRISALYGEATCFVAHSFLEVGPLTPREALSSGVRLVASDIPPHREAAGLCAHYYDPRDPDGLAGAVRAACAEPAPDPGRVGPGWTWAENASKLAEILRSIARV